MYSDIPIFFLKTHVTPGNLEYIRVFERRYIDLVHQILPGDRKFILMRKDQNDERYGYLVKIEEFRRQERVFVIKIAGIERFKADDIYIPDDRRGLYPTED